MRDSKTLTPLQRLDDMRIKAPNAADAKRLLRHLCVFRSAFSRAAVIALAPKDMSTEQRTAAFKTLSRWQLVRRISHRRYEIEDTVRQQFVPSDELCARHFTYILRHMPPDDCIQNHLYWEDIAAALLWKLEHDPHALDELAPQANEAWHIKKTWRRSIEAIASMSHMFNITSQQVFSSQDTAVLEWYDATLQRQIELNSPFGQYESWMYCADVAPLRKEPARARVYLEKALEIGTILWTRQPNRLIWLLQRLIEIALRQHDHTAVYDYAKQLYQLERLGPYPLYKLGEAMRSMSDFEAARRYFSEAYQPENRTEHQLLLNSSILESWAHVERKTQHFQEALRLYELACLHLKDYISYDEARYAKDPAYRAYPPFHQQIKRLSSMEHTRQRIEARMARHTKPR